MEKLSLWHFSLRGRRNFQPDIVITKKKNLALREVEDKDWNNANETFYVSYYYTMGISASEKRINKGG